MRVPPAEASRTSSCAGSLSVAIRARRTSRSVSGRRPDGVGGEQLLGVEGVALGARRDALQELRVGFGTEDGCELGCELGPIEASELDAFRSAVALLLGEEWQEWVAQVELVRSIGNEEDDGAVPQVATEKAEQIERRAVGPVHVLRHDDQRRPRRETLEEQKDVLEQPALRRAVGRRGAGRCRPHRAEAAA